MRLVLLGAPGSGKGTQADLFRTRCGYVHIATGDILRQNLKDRTGLGLQADAFMSKGELVPDNLVVEMIAERLRENDVSRGFLLDGFPRTIPQAESLDAILNDLGWNLDAALFFVIDEEALVRRLMHRRTCRSCGKIWNLLSAEDENFDICPSCGGELYQRDDDKESVIRNRLDVYRNQTEPVVSWYRKKGLLYDIDASKSREETFEEIKSVLGGEI